MSYFFPIPVPFVPGIPMPLFHLNTHSPRSTASSGNSSSSKHKKRVDTVETTGRASTSQETPKTQKKFRPKQLLKWITRANRKKRTEAVESATPESRSFEVPNRKAHPQKQSSETSTATPSPFEVVNRPRQDTHTALFSNADAAIMAAAFRNILHTPAPEALEGLIDDDKQPIDLTFHQEATDALNERSFRDMSDEDWSDTVRASVRARNATHLQQVRVKPFQSPTTRQHSVTVTEDNPDAEAVKHLEQTGKTSDS